MVYRIFVEKKKGFDIENEGLKKEIKDFLRINSLKDLRHVKRYDVEKIDSVIFEYCKKTVFSEPQLDNIYDEMDYGNAAAVIAVEYLAGQFDQRADSCAQCIQMVSQKERPLVRTANIYALYGELKQNEIETIKKYLINPVECKEASLDRFETLSIKYETPSKVDILKGFNALDDNGLKKFISLYGLAMDFDDIKFCQAYFKGEKREPTITEIKMIDTYWSDHCRHTTFLTTIDKAVFEDKEIEKTYKEYLSTREMTGIKKPVTLMDIATIAAKALRKEGKLDKLDLSEEINACTVKIKVEIDNKEEDWLLLFKNETHNHPTEIEPFGGAATCIGGAIRDPLSGRAYVYAAMRLSGAGNPLQPIENTFAGKLPQKKIVTTAAAGYSSYGNQIGIATGIVDEIYHDGYVAKRMEIGAVIGAVPAENVRRENPINGDAVILIGGRTGRDGCGGATGSSKSHTAESLESCGAEVQKGNAPEERKAQRLFRNKEASLLIKRCNDFGAGGVSVAIGEIAEGLKINLDAVPKKYEGLDGTELAISESQERMAVVVAEKDVDKFIKLANSENLEATVVAKVTNEKRLIMEWKGNKIVDIDRKFLNSNGAEKHIEALVEKCKNYQKEIYTDFCSGYENLASDLNICSKKGLSEMFDSTIGAGTVLMPFGGKYQLTPIQSMVNKISIQNKDTDTCSMMSWGYNPFISEKSPYHGAYLAVVESASKLVATGAEFKDVYLTFQEYFEKLGKDSKKWGKPLAALLGAYKAQTELRIAAIGGKDSMSGSFENISVPPTLVSFAVTTEKAKYIIPNEFKTTGSNVIILSPEYGKDDLPTAESLLSIFNKVIKLMREGKVLSCYTPTYGGIAEAIMKMCFGNGIGFEYTNSFTLNQMFDYCYGSFILELKNNIGIGTLIGKTIDEKAINYQNSSLKLDKLLGIYENKLEKIYPCNINQNGNVQKLKPYMADIYIKPKFTSAKPRILIPVFPGTNCEYDTAKAWLKAGALPEIFVINNLTPSNASDSVKSFAEKLRNTQIVFIPGGFSGGDEPDGSGKFITAFFRNKAVSDAVNCLLKEKDGLMCGICNGFQALIKLGLVPYGEIMEIDENSPTLAFNTIGKHRSKIVRTKIVSNKSPWLSSVNVGDIISVPISHGEGRFYANNDWLEKLAQNGQIATQYVDIDGNASSDIRYNPNNSAWAIEGITSPDGRILGKMGHSERTGSHLYKNVEGNYDIKLFLSAVKYFN